MTKRDDSGMSYVDPEMVGEERPNSLIANTRCCFCFPCFGSRRSSSSTVGLAWWEQVGSNSGSSQIHQNDGKWWSRGVKAFKKIREWSELVAGPKWKTFIRRFNRNRSGGTGRHGKFQYDPLSYALNFDEGPRENANFDGEEYDGFRNFSTRYAVFPGSVPINTAVEVESGKDVAVFA
ncbi:NHL domain protein [Quillaja saponaria]|uniref:NHL domain protein n=1 Tax=Quillaja saponaria TaxID=32244 RepID=A0AAD7PHX6_QUISA|nr:NHL domain protein [Quillaja saponaria]